MKKCVFIILLSMVFIHLSGSSQPSEEELLKKLKKCDYTLKCEAAIEWCGILRIKKAVPLLEQLLENENRKLHWQSRIEIIKALGKIGEPRSIGILLRRLPNRDAIFALQQIDPNWKYRQETQEYFDQQLEAFYKSVDSSDIERTFETLLRLDFDEQRVKNLCLEVLTKKENASCLYEVINEAVDWLVKAKAVEAIDPLLGRVENLTGKYNHIGIYVEALDSLFPAWHESPRGKAIEERIIREFKRIKAGIQRPINAECNPSPKNYINKIEVLKWFPSGVSLLLEAVRDEQELYDFRRKAAEALGEIAKPGDTHILRVLIELLKQENSTMSATALWVLKRLGKRYKGTAPAEPAALEIVDKLVGLMENQDPEYFSRDRIIEGLLIWGDYRVAPVLLNLLKDKPKVDTYETFIILDKLIEIGHPETFATVVRLYNAAEKNTKGHYIKILGELKDPQAVPLLRNALTDKNRRVRAYAEWAIYHITKE